MSWSKVHIYIGKTGANEAFTTTLSELGVISDKSTSLSVEDGESLEAKATGGVTVAYEEGEPILSLTTRIKEMSFETESTLIKGSLNTEKTELTVTSNVIDDDYSVKVVPKNAGSIGLKIRRSHISFRPGYSEEEGHYVDVIFKILACADGELYKKFKVTAEDLNPTT